MEAHTLSLFCWVIDWLLLLLLLEKIIKRKGISGDSLTIYIIVRAISTGKDEFLTKKNQKQSTSNTAHPIQ
jgi:hypothetical protein